MLTGTEGKNEGSSAADSDDSSGMRHKVVGDVEELKRE